jgi:Glyoxalase-like domain
MADANIDIVIVTDCSDPETLAEFWAQALAYDKVGPFDDYYVLRARNREHPPVLLQRVPEPKTGNEFCVCPGYPLPTSTP